MSEEKSPSKIEFDLQNGGGVIRIQSAQEMRRLAEDEMRAWEWLEIPSVQQVSMIVQQHRNLTNQLVNLAVQWGQYVGQPSTVQGIINSAVSLFKTFYLDRKIFHSSSVEAAFLSELRQKRGPITAAGAYAMLLDMAMPGGYPTDPKFVEGLFEGFLYKRDVDWTASANSNVFAQLKKQYEAETQIQKQKLEEIETKNDSLNETFEGALKEKSAALQKLHGDQSITFQNLVTDHEKNLKRIELTYDQKLALQKPVKYWQTKEAFHSNRAKNFAWAAGVAGTILAVGYGFLLAYIFSNLKPDENPKEWQIGILVVAAFFAIWMIRVLVRMLFSHLHLATDAAERRTMILTYLAMSREGAQFGKEDKALIVQHLFRTASDGLVKDDAAPPSIFELFTRGK